MSAAAAAAATEPLSSRAARVSKPVVSYFELFSSAAQDVYDAASNPEGSIVLAVAENRLAWGNLAPLFDECAQGFPQQLAGACVRALCLLNIFRRMCGRWMWVVLSPWAFCRVQPLSAHTFTGPTTPSLVRARACR